MSSIFFFQAEDGIRDDLVTGVQTCALPIQAEDGIRDDLVTGVQTCALPISSHQIISYAVFCLRSEEHTSELQSPEHLACRLLLENNHMIVPSPTNSSVCDAAYCVHTQAAL